MAAAATGDQLAVRKAIQEGANLNCVNELGWTPLLQAAMQGQIAIIHILAAAGADPNARDKNGYSALAYACMYNRPDIAEELVRAGADPNAPDGFGRTAYSYWAQNNPALRTAIDRGVATRQRQSGTTAPTVRRW